MPPDLSEKLRQRDADLRRINGLLSRSNHMTVAFLVLSGAGLYMAFAWGRILVAFGLIVAGNALLYWSLGLMSRARLLIKKHERELRNG